MKYVKTYAGLPTWLVTCLLIRFMQSHVWKDANTGKFRIGLKDWTENRTEDCKVFDVLFWTWILLVAVYLGRVLYESL